MLTIEQRINTFFGFTYIIMVTNTGGYEIIRAHKAGGMYWLHSTEGGKWWPLLKAEMCQTSYDLARANQHAQPGQLWDKRWAPLSDKMLAHYHMMPDEGRGTGPVRPTDPQMPE